MRAATFSGPCLLLVQAGSGVTESSHKCRAVGPILLQTGAMADTILIVDDEPDVVDLLVYHFHKAGYKTAAARTGNAALQKAHDQTPTLIVLDLMLPEVD
ncbi:MAG: response regulator transcription factor, partial [Planctomycetes bacterium]|nr:response regulator transcription factor [Planctomycetota bacterium]